MYGVLDTFERWREKDSVPPFDFLFISERKKGGRRTNERSIVWFFSRVKLLVHLADRNRRERSILEQDLLRNISYPRSV